MNSRGKHHLGFFFAIWWDEHNPLFTHQPITVLGISCIELVGAIILNVFVGFNLIGSCSWEVIHAIPRRRAKQSAESHIEPVKILLPVATVVRHSTIQSLGLAMVNVHTGLRHGVGIFTTDPGIVLYFYLGGKEYTTAISTTTIPSGLGKKQERNRPNL